MDNTTRGVRSKDLAEMHSLGAWTRRYVQSRGIAALIGITVFGAIMVAMIALWSAAGDAYRSDNRAILFVCGVGLIVTHAALVWLSVPRWGGRWLERTAWRFYDREGQAAPRETMSPLRMRIVGGTVAFVFGACVLAHVALGVAGIASDEMMMPISALYIVPFLTFLFVAIRIHIMLLYPLLYGLHAAAIAVGLPDPLASFVPLELRSMAAMWIWGAIAVAVSHVYNRIALSRMAHFGRMESKHDG